MGLETPSLVCSTGESLALGCTYSKPQQIPFVSDLFLFAIYFTSQNEEI